MKYMVRTVGTFATLTITSVIFASQHTPAQFQSSHIQPEKYDYVYEQADRADIKAQRQIQYRSSCLSKQEAFRIAQASKKNAK